MAVLECANDVGGRCALWPSGDAHACYGVGHDHGRNRNVAHAEGLTTPHVSKNSGEVRVRTQICSRLHVAVPTRLQGNRKGGIEPSASSN